jgi:hypothetical protein
VKAPLANGRVPYAAAGSAMRDTLTRAFMSDLTPSEWKLVAAILYHVASWSRVEDSVSVSHLASISGVSPDYARKALKKLAQRGVILWEPSRGRGRPSRVGLSLSVGADVRASGHSKNRSSMTAAFRGGKRPQPARKTGSPVRPPSEKDRLLSACRNWIRGVGWDAEAATPQTAEEQFGRLSRRLDCALPADSVALLLNEWRQEQTQRLKRRTRSSVGAVSD